MYREIFVKATCINKFDSAGLGKSNFCIWRVKCWYLSCPAAYISLLRELKYAFQSACFISRSHTGTILHSLALMAIKYEDTTKGSRTEWIEKYMLTLLIWHCCSLQTSLLPSLCNGYKVSALLEAPLELTFWNWVYNGQCCTFILRAFWGKQSPFRLPE